jgi:hypothetical protein
MIKLLIMQFFSSSRYFLLGPNILLNTLFSDRFSLSSPHNVSDQDSHPYKTIGERTKSGCNWIVTSIPRM